MKCFTFEHTFNNINFQKILRSSILKNTVHLKYLKLSIYKPYLPSENTGKRLSSFLYRTSIFTGSCTGRNLFIQSSQSLSHRSGQDNSVKQVLGVFGKYGIKYWDVTHCKHLPCFIFIFWDMSLSSSKYNHLLSFP